MRLLSIFAAIMLVAIMPQNSLAQARIEFNVVYGMYSGTALLLDVHYPAAPNGFGIVFIPGNGWLEPLSFDAEHLKAAMRDVMGANTLLDAGYTLFSINHRSAPAFRYPAPVEDAQRAVRYVRHNAEQYGIDPARIGALGHSAGGHLASMLGVLDGDGDSHDPSPINQESSKVQAVVALAAPSDLTVLVTGTDGDRGFATSLVGTYLAFWRSSDEQRKELSMYAEASPTSYVTADDSPILLAHGDADTVVPFSQSEIFHAELAKSGVPVEFIPVPGGTHGNLSDAPNAPDYLGAIVDWFDQHLRN